jgi:hypothetical protein
MGVWCFRLRQLFAAMAFAFVPAQAQVALPEKPAFLGSKKDVKDIIESFRAAMAALIAQAGGEARVTLVEGYQLADSLINALAANYDKSLGTTFEKLDTQQQRVFEDAYNTISNLEAAVREPAVKFERLGTGATAAIADIASWSKKPIISYYGPNFIAPSSLGDTIRISIAGYRLHAAKVPIPALVIGSKSYPADEYTDVAIGFSIPRAAFPTLEKGTRITQATLNVHRDAGGMLSWFWPQAEQIPFRLMFTVLPENMGEYKLSKVIRKNEVDRKPFVSPTLEVTKNGGGGDSRTDCYVPLQGYAFDLNTAVLKETKHTAYKDNDRSPGTNDGKMSYRDNIKLQDRICILVTAHTGCTECGGTTAGHLQVNMIKPVAIDDPQPDSEWKPLDWKSDIPLRLSDDLVSQTIHIRMFDEITIIASATEPRVLEFIKIEPDLRGKAAYLRPYRSWSVRYH